MKEMLWKIRNLFDDRLTIQTVICFVKYRASGELRRCLVLIEPKEKVLSARSSSRIANMVQSWWEKQEFDRNFGYCHGMGAGNGTFWDSSADQTHEYWSWSGCLMVGSRFWTAPNLQYQGLLTSRKKSDEIRVRLTQGPGAPTGSFRTGIRFKSHLI